MRRLERILAPLCPAVAFVTLSLLRCGVGPAHHAPPESELAVLLGDLGHVRAWSALVGDRGETPIPAPDGGWATVSHYLLTAPDGRAGLLSVATRAYPSEAAASAAFDSLAVRLESLAAARPSAEPGRRLDFPGAHDAPGGWQAEARSRLLRDGRAVALVRLLGSPAAGRLPADWREALIAFERTAARVQAGMREDPADLTRGRR